MSKTYMGDYFGLFKLERDSVTNLCYFSCCDWWYGF